MLGRPDHEGVSYRTRRPSLSIRLLIIINFLTLLLSLVVLGVGIWIAHRGYHCSSHIQWFIISIGIIMFVVSFIGLTGARRRILGLIWLYIALLTLIILLLIIFTTFAFLLKSHGFQDLLQVNALQSSPLTTTHDLTISTLLSAGDCNANSLLNFKHDWGTVSIVSLVILLLLLLVYVVACFAFVRAMNQGVFHHTF